MKSPITPCMIVLELNEAEHYFIDIFIEQGYLPNFKKLLQQGRHIRTVLDKLNALKINSDPINPGLVWPSIYTGLLPAQHGITGHGQEGFQFSRHTIWGELNSKGYSTGLMGIPLHESLQASGIRHSRAGGNPEIIGSCTHLDKIQFYLPEPIKSQSQKIYDLPLHSQSVQDLLLFTSQIYYKNYAAYSLKLLWKLLRSLWDGLPFNIIWNIAKKIPADMFSPKKYYQHMLWYANLQMSIFEYLNSRYAPQFSICHINLLAEIQSRFWRAMEPENFSEALGEVDKCFYTTTEERNAYEHNFKFAILESFILADEWLGKWMAKIDAQANAMLVVMNGLGQQKHDPGTDLNPSLFFHNIDKLMNFVDISEYHLLAEKCRDLTLIFKNEDEAELAVYKFSEIKLLAKKSFFKIKRIKHQLFLEANLTPEIWSVGSAAWLENEATGKIARLFDFVYFSPSIDQETSKRNNEGWMLLYGNCSAIQPDTKALQLTEIKDFLMQYFNINVTEDNRCHPCESGVPGSAGFPPTQE